MERNKIQNHNKLFGILQYMFRDDFNFSRPYISATGTKNINNKKFLLHLLENIEEIEIEYLIGICEENGIPYVAITYLIGSLHPDFIRVDEFTLMRPESIGITDEIISEIVESIWSAIKRNGGWQAAQTFEDYEWLPQLETSWNSFLLENVVSIADDAPYSLKISSTSTIFLSEEFAEDDFQSFLTKILIAEHNKEPFRSEKEIFNWLKQQGLCNKKLPKFEGLVKEVRPVFFGEPEFLGADKNFGWKFPKSKEPLCWAEDRRYFYRGELVAETQGGNLFGLPALKKVTPNLSSSPVNIKVRLAKNENSMNGVIQQTLKNIYDTFKKYKSQVDLFYLAFSSGKDSTVMLDLVQRALPHDSFDVIFGDTTMELSDTYRTVARQSQGNYRRASTLSRC